MTQPRQMPSLLQHLSRGLLCFFIHPSTHHVRYSGRKGFIHQPILSQHPQAHTDEENRGVENAAFLLICSRDHSSQFCGQNKLAVKSRKIFGAKIGEADIAPSCQPVWLQKGLEKKMTERRSGGRKAGWVVLIWGLFIWASIILLDQQISRPSKICQIFSLTSTSSPLPNYGV